MILLCEEMRRFDFEFLLGVTGRPVICSRVKRRRVWFEMWEWGKCGKIPGS